MNINSGHNQEILKINGFKKTFDSIGADVDVHWIVISVSMDWHWHLIRLKGGNSNMGRMKSEIVMMCISSDIYISLQLKMEY